MLIYIKDNWKKREKQAIYKMFQLRVDFSLIFFPNNTFTTFLKEFLLRYQKFRIMNHYHGGQNVLLRSCVSVSRRVNYTVNSGAQIPPYRTGPGGMAASVKQP